ncbi:hypothetical protein DOTSEDRAFT_173826 [Dothistroma septosporum NZE10]|uniref:NADH:flavin oxidoreductase/NADH oxidase N-terminal domain-containing protein n=1 Tax=Dothistroma septosporum (strain NZE10 / CBS 128990) TaxID=675120 RepID=M2XKW8_DOTSN|nr:hypothetical protein DOTSEDRAFT_173826 [Dothistroma septosporum NZE10]
MTVPTTRLFEPLQIGAVKLTHRIVMGPLCSNTADENNVLTPPAVKYFSERAQYPGTLIIGEATFVSPRASGTSEPRAGIWTDAQIAGWRDVVSAVHAQGSFIFLQLWALGRCADPEIKKREGTGDVISSSAVPAKEDGVVPRPLTTEEIWSYVKDYAVAARTAVKACGFDGVELHGGNASLIDQFTQDCVNRRNDGWGGSVENRSRFALEITKAVCEAVGADRIGFRISPWSTYQGMGMERNATIEQFSHLLRGLKASGIAYIHLVESRIAGRVDVEAGDSLDAFTESWGEAGPFMIAGGYDPTTARAALDKQYRGKDVAIAFGRAFVTNPDLVARVRGGRELVENKSWTATAG